MPSIYDETMTHKIVTNNSNVSK